MNGTNQIDRLEKYNKNKTVRKFIFYKWQHQQKTIYKRCGKNSAQNTIKRQTHCVNSYLKK